MSLKIENAFNVVKETCASAAQDALVSALLDPVRTVKIVTLILALILSIVFLAIVLNRYRRSVSSKSKDKPSTRQRRRI